MSITATKTKVSTKTKVLIVVGFLALLGLASYGFGLLPVSQTTYNPPLAVKPGMVMMKTADAPNGGKVAAGKSVVIGKLAMTSSDIQKWGSATLVSITARVAGSVSATAFKNFKLCNQFGACVPGAVSSNDIIFSNVGPVITLSKQTSLIPVAHAQGLAELTLTVVADIGSGYRGTLTLSLPSVSSVNTLKISNWTPTSAFLSKAGITNLKGIIGPNDLVGPNSIVGPSEVQMSFLVGPNSIVGPSESLEIGSIIIY